MIYTAFVQVNSAVLLQTRLPMLYLVRYFKSIHLGNHCFLFNIAIIPFVHSVSNKSPSLQMWLSCILPINIYIRMVLKVLFQKLCCQTSINFSVFIAKIILKVLRYYINFSNLHSQIQYTVLWTKSIMFLH